MSSLVVCMVSPSEMKKPAEWRAERLIRFAIKGFLQEGREIPDRPDMGLLGLVTHPADAHLFDHPLAQWRGSFLRHENLLSDD
ncbi:MAG: hypothetical protein WD036_02960 [Bauldia sp.]